MIIYIYIYYFSYSYHILYKFLLLPKLTSQIKNDLNTHLLYKYMIVFKYLYDIYMMSIFTIHI